MIYHSKLTADDSDGYALTDLDAEARQTCTDLKPHLGEFDIVAVTGLSGILPGVAVSLKLNVPLAILRKPEDNAHQYGGPKYSADGSRWVNGPAVEGCRVLWLDDFSSSGDTRRRILNAVLELGGKVVAEYMTRDRVFHRSGEER